MEFKKDDYEDSIKLILSDLKPPYSSYSQCHNSNDDYIISSSIKRIKNNYRKKKIIDDFSMFKNNKNIKLIKKNQFFNISFFSNIHKDNKEEEETKKKIIDFKIKEKIKKKENLDLSAPGRYFPKYNLIFKRSPSFSIGTPHKKNNSNNIISAKYLLLNKNNKENIFTSINDLKKLNYNINNISNNNELLKSKPIGKKNNVLKNINDNINKKEHKIISNNNSFNSNKIRLFEKIKIKKNLKTNRQKNYMLNFKKMLGRNIKIKKENSFIRDCYNPIYEQTLPHIKSVIFNPKENKQRLKKFMNKQILYKYNPTNDEYFVFRFHNFYENEN